MSGEARQVALAVPRVREALLAGGGRQTLPALAQETGLPLELLVPALGELFESTPGRVDVAEDGEFFIALEEQPATSARAQRSQGRVLGGLRWAMYSVFALYSAIYAGALVVAAAALSGQSSLLRWALRFVRGAPAGEAPKGPPGPRPRGAPPPPPPEPAVPPLRDRLTAFFLGPEGLLPDQWEADRTALHASRLRDRTLTPVDLMAIFGYDRARAEAEASRIAFQHGGGVEHEDGRIWFTFPGFPELSDGEADAARRRVSRGAADDIARRAEVLRRDRVALGLGVANLVVSLLFLALLSAPLLRFLLGWLPLGLSSGLIAHAALVHFRREDSLAALRRQGLRAELVREILHGEGHIRRPLDAPAEEQEALASLARELNGRLRTADGYVEGQFDEAYHWTMHALAAGTPD